MKNQRRVPVAMAVLAAAALVEASAASAQELPGPYAGVGVGANFLQNMTVSDGLGSTTLKYDPGPIATGELGYALGNGFRGEFQYGYRHSDANSTSLPTGPATAFGLKGNAAVNSYMVNGLYDFRVAPSLWANIGAGLGAATVSLNDLGNHTAFAYQAMTGIEYGLTPRLKIGVEYDFLGTNPLSLQSSSPVTSHPTYLDHAVLLTLRYSFGPAPVRAAAVVTPPAPPVTAPAGTTAPPPPFSRDFSIYFATGSDKLTPDARETVRQAAEATAANAPTRINVGGHTDTVGSASYNERLSARRAESVRRELIADGVASDQITTRAFGESDLAVPTANNVPEKANRRVVIVVQGPGT
jgi:OmpA-OmpF porin, OOP family